MIDRLLYHLNSLHDALVLARSTNASWKADAGLEFQTAIATADLAVYDLHKCFGVYDGKVIIMDLQNDL